MIEMALTALALTVTQQADDDRWEQVGDEWQRRLTCTVDISQQFHMPESKGELDFHLTEGDRFGMILHATEDNRFAGISVEAPNGEPEEPIRAVYCDLHETGSLFRCNIVFAPLQVIDFYGSLDQHRFHITWLDTPVSPARQTGSDPSRMIIWVTGGVCVD